MDDLGGRDAAPRTARARSLRSGLVAAGAAVGLALAGLGVAVAQTDASTTTRSAQLEAPGPRQGGPGHRDVKQGDQVRVMAVVRDGKASAVDANDGTQVGQLRSRWIPSRPEPPGPGNRPS